MSWRWIAILAAAGCMAAKAQDTAPYYSAESIVDSAGFTRGELAPWSLATIFGDRLSFSSDASSGAPREELANVRVFVNTLVANLLYVSPTQINLLVPHSILPGRITIRVNRQGRVGPDVALSLVEAVPALFRTDSGYVIAAHADGSVAGETTPAKPGEIVVLYAAGLGVTKTWPPVSNSATEIVRRAALTVLLNGEAVPGGLIKYAGTAPAWPGLYQVNLEIPENSPADPEIRIAIGQQSSPPGLKLAVGR
jgi:uncharacterized protein (TIGR03437 family)